MSENFGHDCSRNITNVREEQCAKMRMCKVGASAVHPHNGNNGQHQTPRRDFFDEETSAHATGWVKSLDGRGRRLSPCSPSATAAMRGIWFSATSAVIVAASLLAYQTGAHAVAQQHQRKLSTAAYSYVGCFKDEEEDRILGGRKLHDAENMTAEFCWDHCIQTGSTYMGTQYGVECWCTSEVDIDYERHGEGALCNDTCAGDENQICGGDFAITLYYIGLDDASSDPLEGAFSTDIIEILDVEGDEPGGEPWADSYSIGDKCFMHTNFDHNVGALQVDTPRGTMNIEELFKILKPGPGHGGRPLYNDIQCGHGPPNDAGDEDVCPGLVEFGRDGCGQIGPKWDLSELES